MTSYRTILAVDHYDLLVEGRSIINRYPNLVLAGEAAIGIELLTLLQCVPAQMVLISMAAPSREKLAAIRTVAREFLHLKLLYMSNGEPFSCASGTSMLHPLNDVPRGAFPRKETGAALL